MTIQSNDTKRLIYVIGTYPSLTTTFIDREIRALRGWGIDVHVVAMRRPPPDLPLSAAQRTDHDVTYLMPLCWRDFSAAWLFFCVRHPLCLIQTLLYLLTRPHPSFRAWLKTLLHFGEGVYAAFLVRNRQARELHAHFTDRAATIALVMGRLLDKSYSLSIHAGADVYVAPVLLREKVVAARHVVTCTRFNKSYVLRQIGTDCGQKITAIPHGIELGHYEPMNLPPPERPIILSVGQLSKRKGLDHLVLACRALRDKGYAFVCHIVGEGPERAELETLVAYLGLGDSVILCGALPHEQVIDQYAQATLFALPCVQTETGDIDGIPNVLAEAMAMGLPVISTHLSAIPELVEHGVTGILVPPGDDTLLTEAIVGLLERPGLRDYLGQNGRSHVLETFDSQCNVWQFGATLWPDWFARPLPTLN